MLTGGIELTIYAACERFRVPKSWIAELDGAHLALTGETWRLLTREALNCLRATAAEVPVGAEMAESSLPVSVQPDGTIEIPAPLRRPAEKAARFWLTGLGPHAIFSLAPKPFILTTP